MSTDITEPQSCSSSSASIDDNCRSDGDLLSSLDHLLEDGIACESSCAGIIEAELLELRKTAFGNGLDSISPLTEKSILTPETKAEGDVDVFDQMVELVWEVPEGAGLLDEIPL